MNDMPRTYEDQADEVTDTLKEYGVDISKLSADQKELYCFLREKFDGAWIIQTVWQRLGMIVNNERRLELFLNSTSNMEESDLVDLYEALGEPKPVLEMPAIKSVDEILRGTHADWSGEWAGGSAGREE